MTTIFEGMTGDHKDAGQLALNFYGPIFLLYSIYDGAEEKETVLQALDRHMDRFSEVFQEAISQGGHD